MGSSEHLSITKRSAPTCLTCLTAETRETGSSSSIHRPHEIAGTDCKGLHPAVVANLEPRIRVLSRQLLDEAIDRGEMDLSADFAVPLPMLVIAEMMGVPRVIDRVVKQGWPLLSALGMAWRTL